MTGETTAGNPETYHLDLSEETFTGAFVAPSQVS
jgi:hypothetical protein